MKLKDRVAVITGAGSGIGRASRAGVRTGGRPGRGSRHQRRGRARRRRNRSPRLGGQAMAVPTDVADPASVQRLVQATLQAYAQVHVLCSNAAIQVNKTVEDTTVEEWNREMAVNVGGIFLCAKFFLPHLRRTKGCIINMASVNGFFVEPLCAGYCATKGAIIALTKAWPSTTARKAFASTASVRGTSTRAWPGATSRRSPTQRRRARRRENSTPCGGSANPRR